MFLKPKRIYNGPFDGRPDQPLESGIKHPESEVPNGYYALPFGEAAVRRPGDAITVLAYGTMVYVALAAATESGIDAEIIDLRTLVPLDLDTIVTSVNKTGRCVIVHEAPCTSGFAGELIALIQQHCFYSLEAPIERVAGWDTPYPLAFEWDYFVMPARLVRALHRVIQDFR